MNKHLITIIIAVYNGERYIEESVASALGQSHEQLEVIVVDDGSTDNTWHILNQMFSDPRLILIQQENKGVSAARNAGLEVMSGDFFCFLDADDIYPPDALQSRLQVFEEDNNLSFVDGVVLQINEALEPTGVKYLPNFKGNPLSALLKLSPTCFWGPSWMIKREPEIEYRFDERLTHAEDLYFYLSICLQRDCYYSFTDQEVLFYRVGHVSAMSNLLGLEKGYHLVLNNLKKVSKVSWAALFILRLKVMKIMFLSHLFDGRDMKNALLSIYRLIR